MGRSETESSDLLLLRLAAAPKNLLEGASVLGSESRFK